MYSYGSPHMAVQKQDNQYERTFSSYVRIRDVVLKTYQGRWTIGRSGERGSGISVLPARYDDDDIYIYMHLKTWGIRRVMEIMVELCVNVNILVFTLNHHQVSLCVMMHLPNYIQFYFLKVKLNNEKAFNMLISVLFQKCVSGFMLGFWKSATSLFQMLTAF